MKTNRDLIAYCMAQRACSKGIAYLDDFPLDTPIADVYRALPAHQGAFLTWIMRHLCAPHYLIDARYVDFTESFLRFRKGCYDPKFCALVVRQSDIDAALSNFEDAIASEWEAWKQSFEVAFLALGETIP